MLLADTYKDKFSNYLEKNKEIGFVEKIVHPVIYINGLPGAKSWEVVYFETGHLGVVTSLSADYVEVMLLGNETIGTGVRVSRSNEVLKVPVGASFLGKVISPFGMPLDIKEVPPHAEEYRDIDSVPLGLESRERISLPLETGVPIVDLLIPLGKGQRELIIGDRNVGKTSFVEQSIIAQAEKDTICIYAAIGKKKHAIKQVEAFTKEKGIEKNVVIVGSSSSAPLGHIYFTPYAAMTMAEYFRDQGKHVLVILDDLTTHAKYYREISLTQRKFPGRDSYPGDIFYAHARLLERAGNFKVGESEASITCLPIAETIGGDISGYIQTNLMSITDGHIFFDVEMYKKGIWPAINYFLSVTRVGRQTQSRLRWGINRELSSFLVLHNKTERFIHFGAELNEGIKSTLAMGDKINIFFDQPAGQTLEIPIQILIFSMIWIGVLKEESEVKLRFYTDMSQKLYRRDSVFKNKVDTLLKSCKEFNQLLGVLSSQYKDILDYMDKPQDAKSKNITARS